MRERSERVFDRSARVSRELFSSLHQRLPLFPVRAAGRVAPQAAPRAPQGAMAPQSSGRVCGSLSAALSQLSLSLCAKLHDTLWRELRDTLRTSATFARDLGCFPYLCAENALFSATIRAPGRPIRSFRQPFPYSPLEIPARQRLGCTKIMTQISLNLDYLTWKYRLLPLVTFFGVSRANCSSAMRF